MQTLDAVGNTYLKDQILKYGAQRAETEKFYRLEIETISEVMTKQALQNIKSRLQECIAHLGKYLNNIIF